MSKNLHEPSTQTDIANQGYRIRQLERRPASGSSGLPSAFLGANVDSDLDPTTPTDWTWSYFSTTDAAVFDNDGANVYMDLLVPGLYLYSMHAAPAFSAALFAGGAVPGERVLWFGIDGGGAQWLEDSMRLHESANRIALESTITVGFAYTPYLTVTAMRSILAPASITPFLFSLPVLAATLASIGSNPALVFEICRLGEATP